MKQETQILETLKDGNELITTFKLINIYEYTNPECEIPPGYMDIMFDSDSFLNIDKTFVTFQKKIITLLKYEQSCINNESFELATAIKMAREELFTDTYAFYFSKVYSMPYDIAFIYLCETCKELSKLLSDPTYIANIYETYNPQILNLGLTK